MPASEEYLFINQWLLREPDIELIVPYVREVKSKMSNQEVNKLRERFLYKKQHGHEDYKIWALVDIAAEVGFKGAKVL
jgi:hypothetical protein